MFHFTVGLIGPFYYGLCTYGLYYMKVGLLWQTWLITTVVGFECLPRVSINRSHLHSVEAYQPQTIHEVLPQCSSDYRDSNPWITDHWFQASALPIVLRTKTKMIFQLKSGGVMRIQKEDPVTEQSNLKHNRSRVRLLSQPLIWHAWFLIAYSCVSFLCLDNSLGASAPSSLCSKIDLVPHKMRCSKANHETGHPFFPG